MKRYLAVLAGLLVVGISGASQERKAELESKVKDVLSLDDVSRRKEVGVLFELGDLYAAEGDAAGAMRFYGEGLRVDGLNFAYQIKHAKLLLQDGRTAEAVDKLTTVYTYAEAAATIDEARALLAEQGAAVSLPALKDPDGVSGPIIYLVPVGCRNDVLLRETAAALEKIVALPVAVPDVAALDPGPFDRTAAERYIQGIAKNIIEKGDPKEYRQHLRFASLSSIETAPYGKLKVFVWSFLKANLPDAPFSEFVARLEAAEKDGQYSAERLYRLVVKRYPLAKPTERYLGITDGDIYGENTNFLFGTSGLGHAIMSYHRFGGAFNDAPQNRPRLVRRAVKQAVSSTFFMLNIRRCDSPMCMRAYSSSLEEHDVKDDTLCRWCRQQLEANAIWKE